MICPECHAEYLEHIEKCGDCNIPLVDACILDLPIPEMTWASLPPFEGKIYADMIAEIFDNNEIPYYLKMDWRRSAFSIEGANLTGEMVRIFVPETHQKEAENIVQDIIGDRT